MAILKCKMCGGDIEVIEDTTVMECEYCGSKQTIPSVDNEKLVKLYTRANRLRMNSEFDKAYGVYENIVAEFSEEAEAYWGLILCRYGIEYVDDPATGDKIPTCHRSSFDSIMEDEDFEMVMEYADGISRRVYREQAKQLEEIRKGIIEVSGKEKPYDIFICYKETAEDGERTLDSVMAQDVYQALIQKGYRVFFSRITLEDKLGQEYEPYIFAALNSAKVMLAFGTDYDYYNAVWVKNEWSRFLKLMAKDKEKHLIPCYKNIDAYDMPKEFAKLQAQDLGKVGATQDLLRGIDKIFGKGEFQTSSADTNASSTQSVDIGMTALNAQTTALLKRGYMALEDGEFNRANDFFEQVLNNDAECGQAYWGKALCAKKSRNADELGSRIFQMIQKNEESDEVAMPSVDILKLAKEADEKTGYLKELSDEEIKELLSDLDESITYQDALSYYENIKNRLDHSMISGYINHKDYERAIQYADELVSKCQTTILEKVKSYIEKAITQEHEKVTDAQNRMQKRDESIKDTISQRLSTITEIYNQKKAEYEEAKRAAEEQAESDYQAALKKNESDYQASLKAYEDDYQKSVEEWKKAKEDFEQNASRITNQKAELEGKIAALRSDYDNAKGLFAGRKKKEIQNNIDVLKEQMDHLVIPRDPGDMPVKGSKPIRKEDPGREEFKVPVITEGTDLITEIKCALSPKYKEEYERKEAFKRMVKGAQKGSELNLGKYHYEEDGRERNISWRVLDKQGDRLLLITKEGIDTIRYNKEWIDTTWEKCTLRKWLNNDFVNTAFDDEEKSKIVSMMVTADKNPKYSTNPGNDTKDKIFLLSIPEVEKYFKSNEDRIIKPTPYAKKNGAYTNDAGAACWWLRSPGLDSKNVALVNSYGSVFTCGDIVSNVHNTIRPALWLDISNL